VTVLGKYGYEGGVRSWDVKIMKYAGDAEPIVG
jgi:hypothetical protein